MNIEEIYLLYPTEAACFRELERIIWRDGPECPHCRSNKHTPMPKESRHHCNYCNASYCVTHSTIFYRTRLDIRQWFAAIYFFNKKRLSVRQLAEILTINKNTAQTVLNRIRQGRRKNFELMSSIAKACEPNQMEQISIQ